MAHLVAAEDEEDAQGEREPVRIAQGDWLISAAGLAFGLEDELVVPEQAGIGAGQEGDPPQGERRAEVPLLEPEPLLAVEGGGQQAEGRARMKRRRGTSPRSRLVLIRRVQTVTRPRLFHVLGGQVFPGLKRTVFPLGMDTSSPVLGFRPTPVYGS